MILVVVSQKEGSFGVGGVLGFEVVLEVVP